MLDAFPTTAQAAKRAGTAGMLALCFLIFFGTKASLQVRPIRIGYFKVAPHAMPGPHDEPQGVAVEYFKRVAREMQVEKMEFILLPLERLQLDLANNRVDMALLLAKNSERAAKFVYPKQAFCLTKPSIAVGAANPLPRVKSVDDLLPLSFHETPSNYRTTIMQDPRLDIAPLTGEDFTRRCYAMIVAGRIDACYQPDHYPIQFEALRKEFRSKIKILYLPDPAIGLYSVFSKLAAPQYLERYEKALAAVKQHDSYGAVYGQFISQYQED
jgi:ABC-type amino acid transport substrate-binding protein